MVSSTSTAYNLTVSNSASPSYTLKVMTVVAVVIFPVVLAYQGWSLYVFRKRIVGPTGARPLRWVATPLQRTVAASASGEIPVHHRYGGSGPGNCMAGSGDG